MIPKSGSWSAKDRSIDNWNGMVIRRNVLPFWASIHKSIFVKHGALNVRSAPESDRSAALPRLDAKGPPGSGVAWSCRTHNRIKSPPIYINPLINPYRAATLARMRVDQHNSPAPEIISI
jgi:hypothetical protein